MLLSSITDSSAGSSFVYSEAFEIQPFFDASAAIAAVSFS